MSTSDCGRAQSPEKILERRERRTSRRAKACGSVRRSLVDRKRIKAAFLSALVCTSLLAAPVSAAPADDPNIIKHAFHRDIEKVVDDYIQKKEWDKSKIESPPTTWTGVKGDECSWTNEYQTLLWYDNAYTTTTHLWDQNWTIPSSSVDAEAFLDDKTAAYATGTDSTIGIGMLMTSSDRDVDSSIDDSSIPGPEGAGGTGSESLGLPQASGSNIVSIAASQIGTREIPAGSNYVGYVKWFNGWSDSVPKSSYAPWEWCCIFVLWCANQAGYVTHGTNGKFGWTGGCGPESAYLRNTQGCDYVFTSDVFDDADLQDQVQPGDIVFFSDVNRSLTSRHIAHIGIVESTGTDAGGFYIKTIEGNAGTAGVVGRYTYHKNTYKKFTNGHIVRPHYS